MESWLDLPKPWLVVAPMAGVGDWAFREMCYRFGAEVAVSHLVPVTGLLAKPWPVLRAIEARHKDGLFLAQLCGHRPVDFRLAARLIADHLPVAGIDINMGCPVAPVVGAGGGSALLRDPERARDVVAEACQGTSLPVSVKMRLGWNSTVAVELAPLLEAAGARALAVHGRTKEQHYRGASNLAAIAMVKKAVGIPVIGNGDICSWDSAQMMLDSCAVDGIMVGRGALGNPWLFAELQARLKGNPDYQCSLPIGDIVREHVRLAFADLGPRKAALALRKHLIAYTSGSSCSASLRKELETSRTAEDIERWIVALENARQVDSTGTGNERGLTVLVNE